MVVSAINSQITLEYLQTKVENQYFERKDIGEKDISPTKAEDLAVSLLSSKGDNK